MWIGACLSSVGTWMQKLAQSWLVFELTNSAWSLALDAFLGEIPIFLFSLIGGVVADRMDRRKLLLISQFIQMTCAVTLAALLFRGAVRVEFIYCLSFIVGTAQAFGGPAYQSIIPSLVPKDDLQNAIALNSIQVNLARVIGPVIGGITIAFSASKVFWVSCVILFLGGAALISVFTLVASLVQLQTTDDMRGRVMSVYNVAFRGGMPFGNLTSGRLMELHGAPFILAINGTLLIALSIYFLVVQRKIARI